MDSKSIAGSISQSQISMRSARQRANSEFGAQVSNSPYQMLEQVMGKPTMTEKKGYLDSVPSFQRQAQLDCDSSHKSSHLDGETGVMVVGMGMKAQDLHKAANRNG